MTECHHQWVAIEHTVEPATTVHNGQSIHASPTRTFVTRIMCGTCGETKAVPLPSFEIRSRPHYVV